MAGGIEALTGPVAAEQQAGRVRRVFADMFGFVGTAGKLLFRHWPALLALALLASAAHWWIRVLAVQASRVHSLLGLAVLMFAPLAVLVSYVLMLRVLRQSLPWAQAAHADHAGDGPPRTLLDHLGSVLLPFLAVYASQGYLEEDIYGYQYEVTRDALTANFLAVFDAEHAPGASALSVADRIGTKLDLVTFVVIGVAFAARWAIGRWRGQGRRRAWLGLLGAYLEAVWIMLLIVKVHDLPAILRDWASDRQAVHWVQDLQDRSIAALGVIGGPIDGMMSFGWNVLSSFQLVIVVPLAWLAVGAIIYGHRLGAVTDAHVGEADPDHAQTSAAPPAEPLTPPLTPIQLGRRAAANELRERFGPLIEGLRMLVRGNMRPMLVFCVLFLLLEQQVDEERGTLGGLGGWLWQLERAIIGPQEMNGFWLPFSYLISPINQAVQAVLVVCLLAAAVDRVVLAQRMERIVAERSLLR